MNTDIDTGLQHNAQPKALYGAYERKNAAGEGWHFDHNDNDMPGRADLGNAWYDVFYREDDESFIVVRGGWAVEIQADEMKQNTTK